MKTSRGIVVVLGVTGRLGPAVARAFAGWELRALSRRDFAPGEITPPLDMWRKGERADRKILLELLEGADIVVDLICFSGADAEGLLDVCRSLENPPSHLIFSSSTAQSEVEGAGVEVDPYALGKYEASTTYAEGFVGTAHTLILPRLVASVDHKRREQPYLDSAAGGRALIAGGGAQMQSMAPVDGVAACILRLASEPGLVPSGTLAVAPPDPVRVSAAVCALLDGAGMPQETGRHPNATWRGPHGGGDEVLDASVFHGLFPDFHWSDPLQIYAKLGRWLARTQEPLKRPRLQVSGRHQEFLGNRVVDVHDRRVEVPLSRSIPALRDLAGWLSPSFYIDLGRPCNSACIYCAVPPHADTQGFAPMDQVSRQIASGLAAGCDRAILIGGEPTIHPDLFEVFELLQHARLMDNHVIMTNGLRLAAPGFLSKLAEQGLRTVHLSIDTADPAIYDQISRSEGRFSKQIEALDNLLAREDLHTYIYSAVTGVSSPGLGALLRLVVDRAAHANKAPPPMIFAFVKPIGDALVHADSLMQTFAERAQIARRVVEEAGSLGVTVGFRNLQACLAPELVPHLVDYYLDDYSVDLETHRRRPNAHGSNWQMVDACAGCGHHALCPGIYRGDIRRFGEADFEPIARDGLRG